MVAIFFSALLTCPLSVDRTEPSMQHEHHGGVPDGVDNSLAATCGLDKPVVRNLTQNPLCRLPDNILLQIMDRVDEPGIFCLRRTSPDLHAAL